MDRKEKKFRSYKNGKHTDKSHKNHSRNKHLLFLGHVCRKQDLQHLVSTGEMEETEEDKEKHL